MKRPEITIEFIAEFISEHQDISDLPNVESREPIAESLLTRTLPAFREQPVAKGSSALPIPLREEWKAVETEIKYEGYLQQQQRAMERLKKSEQRAIPDWFDYTAVSGLSREMREKLGRVRPHTIGQASRIPGVTPAAVSLINVYIEIQGRQRAAVGS